MNNFIQITTTVDKKATAEQIANSLLSRKLAGCIQISGPITSVYPWEGKVQSTEEWVCSIKTRADLFKAVQTLINEIHPYELPEIIATPIVKASDDYQDWLDGLLRK